MKQSGLQGDPAAASPGNQAVQLARRGNAGLQLTGALA
jgi:hypothetical protein